MRISLAHKILAAFMLTAVTMLGLLLVVYVNLFGNFMDYTRQAELRALAPLKKRLEEWYAKHKS